MATTDDAPTGPLPEPGSEAITNLLGPSQAALYGYIYEHQEPPPTKAEIRAWIRDVTGEVDPSQTDRRVRDLYKHFDLRAKRYADGKWRHPLRGWAPRQPAGKPLSERVKAEVRSAGRCYYCGKTPKDDGVRLDVDHIVPQAWGGTNDFDNLQPLCEACNGGKKDMYRAYEKYAVEIKQAITRPEPHVRIGELLKAFDGEWAPAEIIAFVASAIQYQEDRQKRLRELRLLGWDIPTPKRQRIAGKRTSVFYRVESWKPWEDGSVAAQIRAAERARRKAKTDLSDSSE